MTQPPIKQYDVGSAKQPADGDAHMDPGGSITSLAAITCSLRPKITVAFAFRKIILINFI